MINLNSPNDSSWPTACCQAPACDVPATKIEPGEPNPGNTIPTLAAPVMPVPEAALGANAGDNATQEEPATVPEPSSTDTQEATQREPETPPERLNTHALEATQRKAETPQGPLNTDTLEATLRDATAPTPGPLALLRRTLQASFWAPGSLMLSRHQTMTPSMQSAANHLQSSRMLLSSNASRESLHQGLTAPT